MAAPGDRLHGWGRETRTTESIRTEIRLSCRENLRDLAEGIVQRRFECELRVREPTAAAGLWQGVSTGRAEPETSRGAVANTARNQPD
jgi:hypothetical protein